LPQTKIFLLNLVQHVDPDQSQHQQKTGEDAAKNIEHHEWCEAGHRYSSDCVEAKYSDTNEDKTTIDLLKCECVPSIKRESEKNEEEENRANTNKDLKTRKHLNRNHRVAVIRDGGLIIETAGLAAQRSTCDAEGQLYDGENYFQGKKCLQKKKI
jgi:hypothetical protein